jgi:hypothetical protein
MMTAAARERLPDHRASETCTVLAASAADTRREFLLASMRVAVLNLKTWISEIEMVGMALRGGAVTLDDACDWLDELGLLEHLPKTGDSA